MKLKDILSKIALNRANGQMTTCIKKSKLKQVGITEEDLFNLNINTKFKTLLED